MDWSRAAVFIDFDGTISTRDTGLHMLERLAPHESRGIEDQYLLGQIGSLQCMVEQWRLLPKDRELIETVVREVPIDPAFPQLVERLRALDSRVTVLSDGYGFRARQVAAEAGVDVLTNDIDWDAFEVVFSRRDSSCPCSACGTCKPEPILAAQRQGMTAVLIGDGPSDARAAEVADFVFAIGGLADWCEEQGIAHHRIARLADLLAILS